MITFSSSAFSEEAANLQHELEDINEWTEQPESFYSKKGVVIDAINALAHECSTADWDGNNAKEISVFTICRAINFIRSLPQDFPLPELSPEPDGAISLDWIQSRNHIFSVSIGNNDRLAFAWLDGTNKGHGVCNWNARGIPTDILYGVSKILIRKDAALWTT